MIGAIKRRWKSKKSKVLSKGSDLSTSTDSCPTSRGFAVDGCEDFEKMIKPPSPRQIHPVLDKGDMKCSHHHHTHYPTTQNHPLFSQYPIRKKSSTLPSSEQTGTCPFIRVNSGRIELVSAKESPTCWKSAESAQGITPNEPYANVLISNTLTSFHPHGVRSRGASGRAGARHSWSGSALREPLADVVGAAKKMSGAGNVEQIPELPPPGLVILRRHNKEQSSTKPGSHVTSKSHHSTPPSPAKAPRKLGCEDKSDKPLSPRPPPPPPPPTCSVEKELEGAEEERVTTPGFSPTMTLAASAGNVRILLSPLKERLSAIEKLTANLQSWQDGEKADYEKYVEDLATQVSTAVALQTLMKSEFEKLQERVEELENHNKTMASMIIPTLMKLQDADGESASQSMVSEAESKPDGPEDGSWEDGKTPKTDCRAPLRETKSNRVITTPHPSELSRSSRANKQKNIRSGMMSKSDNHHTPPSPNRLLSSSSKSESTLTSSASTPPTTHVPRSAKLLHKNQNSSSVTASRPATRTPPTKNSGIPRMSSPRPPRHSSSSPLLESTTRVRKTEGDGQSVTNNSSRLPVRSRGTASANSKIPHASAQPNHPTRPQYSGKHNSKFSKVNGVPIPAGVSRTSSTSSTGTSRTHSEHSGSAIPTPDPLISQLSVKTKSTATKDEGYSTMSSEALAEQEKSTLDPKLPPFTSEFLGSETILGGGSKSKTMHKSNTFNTFREIRLPQQDPPAYTSLLSNHPTTTNPKLIPSHPRNFTSLPVHPATRASILMNRRELSSNLIVSPTLATNMSTSPHHLPRKSPLLSRKANASPIILTSTPISSRPPPFNNVRIIRGIPYELDEGELDAAPSSSTILWEDSDDSDVLFLPLEISSESSSRSTILPQPASSLESAPPAPTKIPSKLPNLPTTLKQALHHHHNSLVIPSKCGKSEKNSPSHSVLPSPLPLIPSVNPEDSELIEKWMRLEDVRNEVQWDDEWAWDWDGVQEPKSLRSVREAEDDNDREGDDEEEEDDDFWRLPSLGKERIQHLTDLFQPPNSSLGHTLHAQESSKGTLVNSTSKSPSPPQPSSSSAPTPPTQIDSSTWTKSKCGKIKAKLAQFHPQDQADSSSSAPPPPPNFDSKSLEKERKRAKTKSVKADSSRNNKLSPTHRPLPTHPSQPGEEEHLLINEQLHFHGDHENESSNHPHDSTNLNQDGPPPVIQFTPEFYHLVNYGSNLSFSDNESNSNSPHHHHHHHHHHPHHPNRVKASSSKSNHPHNPPTPTSSSQHNHSSPSNHVNNLLKNSSKMDDKVSQTDFVSSFENMSISSELFTECRNCLEIIKKLVAEDCVLTEKSSSPPTPPPITTLDRQISIQAAEKKTDAGSPTTWLSIPHGLPSTEVERILEILSSSESEDILSPSK